MIETITSPLRAVWESLLERLLFLPPFPEPIDSLALFSLLLVVGLLLGELVKMLGDFDDGGARAAMRDAQAKLDKINAAQKVSS